MASLSDQEIIDYKSQPVEMKCAFCHEIQKELPMQSGDETCISCHALTSKDDPKKVEKIFNLCFTCHSGLPESSKIAPPMKAAKANNALFYPVNPGNEEKSWQRFHDEALDKFINAKYAGSYEDKVIAEFDEYLPETPPWQK